MNKVLLLLFIPFFVFAQKTKFTVLPAGYIVKNNTELEGEVLIGKSDHSSTLMAMEPGYATEFFSADSIIGSGKKAYTFYMKPVLPLDRPKVRRKLAIGEIADKTYKIRYVEQVGSYMAYQEYNSTEFKEALGDKLGQHHFLMGSSAADYVLSGEITHYVIDRKGTPGYRISLAIKWSLRDLASNTVIYTAITGGYSNARIRMSEKSAFRLALEDAIGGVITDETIRQLMYGSANAAYGSHVSSEISIPAVPASSGVESAIERAIAASVTIKTKEGHGSGFLISADGYILTSFHVIRDSSDLQAVFQNELSLPLHVVSYDPKMDVALCKIPGKGYKPLELDTAAIVKKVGRDVVAVGTPKDLVLGQTVTKGIVSGIRKIEDNLYIQTDATLNAGNSGGLLMNANGGVIGIVCAKVKGEGVEGLGFAVPIGQALNVLRIRIKG